MTEKPGVDQLHSDCKSVSTLAPIHENKSKTLSESQFLPSTRFVINAFQWNGAFYYFLKQVWHFLCSFKCDRSIKKPRFEPNVRETFKTLRCTVFKESKLNLTETRKTCFIIVWRNASYVFIQQRMTTLSGEITSLTTTFQMEVLNLDQWIL